MKLTLLHRMTALVGLLTFMLLVVTLVPSKKHLSVYATLARVPVLELPKTAAEIVSSAPPNDRQAIGQEVIQSVGWLAAPGILPYTVSSVSRACPEVAVQVAKTAAAISPGEVLPIAKAAMIASPTTAVELLAALTQESPERHAALAQIAAEVSSSLPVVVIMGKEAVQTGLAHRPLQATAGAVEDQTIDQINPEATTAHVISAKVPAIPDIREFAFLAAPTSQASLQFGQPESVATRREVLWDELERPTPSKTKIVKLAKRGEADRHNNPTPPPPAPPASRTVGSSPNHYLGGTIDFQAGQGLIVIPRGGQNYAAP